MPRLTTWCLVLLLAACDRNRSTASVPERRVAAAPDAMVMATPTDAFTDASIDADEAPLDAVVAVAPATKPAPQDESLGCKIDPVERKRCQAASKIYGPSLAHAQCGGAYNPNAQDPKRPCACYSRAESEAHGNDCLLVPSAPRGR